MTEDPFAPPLLVSRDDILVFINVITDRDKILSWFNDIIDTWSIHAWCFPIPPQAAAAVESRATTETQNSMAIQSSASAGAVGAASSLLSIGRFGPVGYSRKQESLSP
jgi:hypothetical protein